ncbi:hypothetical protein Tco_1476844 [Tanacetum coccineum]
MQTQEGMANEGITLDAGLDSKASTYDNTSTEQQDGRSSSGDAADAKKAWDDKAVSEKENAAVGPSLNNNTLIEVHLSNNDTFENVFALEIQNHGQLEVENCTKGNLLYNHSDQSVVRQPNAFKSERPKLSKPRFASQVDVKNDLSKPITPHYWPNVREPAFIKPHHVIASSESKNSSKNMPRFSSNNMVHNHYLEEAKKKTQERDINSNTSVMPSARLPTTTNDRKPKPRSMNQMTRIWPTYKSGCVTKTNLPNAEHSKNSSSF